jgi:hypothetical protein
MKIKLLSLLCAVAGFLSLTAGQSVAGVSWSVSVFDGPLGRCGNWIDRPGYGRCWHPAYVSSDWRPYCEGYWMWTDGGWYWVSTEEWGWATYHYGRWDDDPYYGWVWVPDTEWGPSWVEWREGDEYVGWAPLPPGAHYGPDGYVFVREHPRRDNFFVFVQIGHFSEPVHRRAVIVNNTTIINKTVNITRITRVNNVVVNNGPRVENIQRVSSRKLTEPPPHMAPQQLRESRANTFKPVTGQEPRSPMKEEKAPKREPQIIRGSPGAPEATGSKGETGRKQFERPATEPTPTEKPERRQKDETVPSDKQRSSQNFAVKPTRPYAPVEPDSVQPKQRSQPSPSQERATEKRESRQQERESRQQDGKDEKSKKGDQGGN